MMWLPCGLLFAPWAAVSALRHRKCKAVRTHVITVRHSTALAAAIGSWRIAYGARKFDVIGLPRNIDEAGRWLVFDCGSCVMGMRINMNVAQFKEQLQATTNELKSNAASGAGRCTDHL